jgi:hypothetical protein
LVAVIITTCLAHAAAQHLVVTGNHTEIPNGSTLVAEENATDLGSLAQGSGKTIFFTAYNEDTVTTLTINGAVFVGTNAGDFSGQGVATIPPGGQHLLSFSFAPQGSGDRTATLRLLSNDPSNSIYAFDLAGTTNPDNRPGRPMQLQSVAGKIAKGKDKNGTISYTIPGMVMNERSTLVDSVLVELFLSPKPYLTNGSSALGNREIRKVKPGKGSKFKKFKFKMQTTGIVPQSWIVGRLLNPGQFADGSRYDDSFAVPVQVK